MPRRMPRFHSADRPLTFPDVCAGFQQGDARVQGRPQFHSNSSVHEPGQARGRARVCTSVTSPAHHVPSEPGSPYSKAQRGGLDGSGHSARLFQGTTDLQMQRLLYREAASGLPGQHFPPQPRTQARNKTSRFHRYGTSCPHQAPSPLLSPRHLRCRLGEPVQGSLAASHPVTCEVGAFTAPIFHMGKLSQRVSYPRTETVQPRAHRGPALQHHALNHCALLPSPRASSAPPSLSWPGSPHPNQPLSRSTQTSTTLPSTGQLAYFPRRPKGGVLQTHFTLGETGVW